MALLTLEELFEWLRANSFPSKTQELTPKLLALAKVSSVLGNIRDTYRSVGVCLREGEQSPFCTKMVRTKITSGVVILTVAA